MKLTIAKKLLAAYLLMALFTILVGSYALFSLQHLNELAYTILKKDFLIIYHGRQMLDNLLAQERSEKKFIILKDPALAELYWARSAAVNESIKNCKKQVTRRWRSSCHRSGTAAGMRPAVSARG